MTIKTALIPAALLTTVALAAAGCSSSKSSSPSGQSSPSAPSATLTVLAAASLTNVLPQEESEYEKTNPNIRFRNSFAGSQDLAAQVKQGVPADALITADTKTMTGVASFVGEDTVIARNRLVIVTAPGDPMGIKGLSDLAKPGLKLVLAASAVPAGKYAAQALAAAHVTVHPVSEETDVRSVLSRVELGEADAGIVYVTDALVGGSKVATVQIPDAQNIIAVYPAAEIKTSSHASDVQAFITWLAASDAQQILQKAGFAPA